MNNFCNRISLIYIGRNREDVKGYLKKKKHNQTKDMLLFFSRELKIAGLPTAAVSQNRQHIGHHRDCDDEQFDRYLLHDITSFKMDLWVGN
jgi:hypothetical protein